MREFEVEQNIESTATEASAAPLGVGDLEYRQFSSTTWAAASPPACLAAGFIPQSTALAEGCRMSEGVRSCLPPVAFYSIYEIAVRGDSPADVRAGPRQDTFQVLARHSAGQLWRRDCRRSVEVPIPNVRCLEESWPEANRHGCGGDAAQVQDLAEGDRPSRRRADPVTDLLLRRDPAAVRGRTDLLRPASTIGASPRYDWGFHVCWLTVPC